MTASTHTPAVTVTLRGNVGSGTVTYAQEKVAAVLAEVGRPILGAKVVLDWHRDPALHRPARVDVGVNVNGTIVRAKSERPTMQEAIDEMEERLRRRIRALQDRERSHRHDASLSRQRHSDVVRSVAVPLPRLTDDQEILRERAEPAPALTPEEASYEMDLVDHEFYLFQDAASGSPALLRRAGPHAYTIDVVPPTLTESQAVAQLDRTAEPLAFYVDADSGEARVLHVRPDGRRASISLVAEPVVPR